MKHISRLSGRWGSLDAYDLFDGLNKDNGSTDPMVGRRTVENPGDFYSKREPGGWFSETIDKMKNLVSGFYSNGPLQAFLNVGGGFALVTVGALTLPEGAPLVGAGLALFSEGAVLSAAELLGGDTGSIPTEYEIFRDIGIGIHDSYSNDKCD